MKVEQLINDGLQVGSFAVCGNELTFLFGKLAEGEHLFEIVGVLAHSVNGGYDLVILLGFGVNAKQVFGRDFKIVGDLF